VQDDAVPDHAFRANDDGEAGVRVRHGVVLETRLPAQQDALHVAPQHGAWPHVCPVLQDNIADDGGVGVHEGAFAEHGYSLIERGHGHAREYTERAAAREAWMDFVHVATRTKDLDAAIAFYELLGMKCVRRKELTEGRASLAFMEPPQGNFAIELVYNWGKDDAYDGGDRFGHFAFEVDDLRTQFTAILDGGGTLIREPYLLEGDGPLLAFVADPDGNLIELIQRPA
jgi:lactoylglutathione lyase